MGNTALHIAIEKGDIEGFKLAIKAGVDINAVNMFGETALNTAVQSNDVQAISELITAGADSLC